MLAGVKTFVPSEFGFPLHLMKYDSTCQWTVPDHFAVFTAPGDFFCLRRVVVMLQASFERQHRTKQRAYLCIVLLNAVSMSLR